MGTEWESNDQELLISKEGTVVVLYYAGTSYEYKCEGFLDGTELIILKGGSEEVCYHITVLYVGEKSLILDNSNLSINKTFVLKGIREEFEKKE